MFYKIFFCVQHTITYVLHNMMHFIHTILYVIRNIIYSARYYVLFQIPVLLHFYQLFKNKIAPPITITNNGDRALRRKRKHKMI